MVAFLWINNNVAVALNQISPYRATNFTINWLKKHKILRGEIFFLPYMILLSQKYTMTFKMYSERFEPQILE
jgi:hypothetical protein